MKYPGFIGGSNENQGFTADQQRTINWYVEPTLAPGAPSEAVLLPTPGVRLLNGNVSRSSWETPGRAHFFESGREFAVIGTQFYEVDEGGTVTSRGTVAVDDNPATISSNGDIASQLFITSGTNAYYFTLGTNTLTQITGMDGKATMGAFLDGYFLALDGATSTLYISALGDGSDWTPGTDFAQRSVASDPWVSMKVLGRYVWLLGESTSEAWYNAGGVFPLKLHPSSLVRYGCAAPWSVGVAEQSLLWLGSSELGEGYVVQTQGFTPRIVSTFSVQSDINNMLSLSGAQADVYSDRGHTFYVLSIAAEKKTWAFDLSTGIWAERGTWIAEDAEWVAWRPQFHARAFNQSRWLDSVGGEIWHASSDYHTGVTETYAGLTQAPTTFRPIRRLRRAPALQNERKRIYFSSFELDLEAGLGLKSGQGENPQVMMRMSNDGGKTWGPERWRSSGKIGEYGARVHWDRLGSARRRVFEVSVTDPIPWRITDAYLIVSGATNG